MKTKISILALLFSLLMNAQQGVNYKAVISENGAVIQNQIIAVYFTILEDGTTNVYEENHTVATDDNGIIILNIGVGVVTGGDFTLVDWSKEQFLKVEVNTGSGITDMGTTMFKAVPYALYSEKSAETIFTTTNNVTSNIRGDIATDDFVFGDTQLDGAGTKMFFDKSKGAFRAGRVSGTQWDSSNIINYSFASGYNTIASGNSSTAMGVATKSSGAGSFSTGNSTIASGDYSITTGWSTYALGLASISMGDRTRAEGQASTAMGSLTVSESYAQTSLGLNNTNTTGNTTSFDAVDRLFVIGNGADSSNKSDALEVLKNGTITAPSLTNNLIDIAGDKALITKEYADMLRPKTYEIGDFALGGVVFWVDEAGQHGLVCSLENLSSGIVWMDHDNANSFNINFTSGNGIGAGELNTSLILSSNDVQNLSATNFAAILCATYSETDINNNSLYDDGGGTITISYGDWYLPSVYELSMMYPHKDLINTVSQENGGEGLADAAYWCSNQYSQTEAWVYFMSDNTPSSDSKNSNNLVRAVRSF